MPVMGTSPMVMAMFTNTCTANSMVTPMAITVRGDGEGSALLAVSLDGAAIIAGSGTSELRLTLQGRRRTQQLVQLGALEIREP